MLAAVTRNMALRQTRWHPNISALWYSGPALDYDHFAHGWAVGDIGDFTRPGKYHMQTFNKISPKVSENYWNGNGNGLCCRCEDYCLTHSDLCY